MTKPQCIACCATILALSFLTGFAPQSTSAQTSGQVSEYPSALIREQQTVIVNGVAETWQLVWSKAPGSACSADHGIDSLIFCPCSGFAFGEFGDLSLRRVLNGREIDRLSLSQYFTFNREVATVPRWPEEKGDIDAIEQPEFSQRVAKRPVVQLMHFADHEHDGQPTQFYLHARSGPCGRSEGVVIGVSKHNPRIHAIGTASNPSAPLYLQPHEWEALRESSGPIEVLDAQCGDHGSEAERRLLLRWTPTGVDGTRREYSCPPSPPRLIKEDPL